MRPEFFGRSATSSVKIPPQFVFGTAGVSGKWHLWLSHKEDTFFLWILSMRLVGVLFVLGYGLFFVIWPERARAQYLRSFDLEAPPNWLKPNTWLTFEPGLMGFRIIGAGLIALALLVSYFWIFP